MTIIDAQTYTNECVTMSTDHDGKPFFSDVKVRRAMVQAIDRSAVISQVLSGRGEADPTPIPAGDWAFTASAAQKYPYDPLAAAAALDAARRTLSPGSNVRSNKVGLPFSITLVTTNTYPSQQGANAIAPQRHAVGIHCNGHPVSTSVLIRD